MGAAETSKWSQKSEFVQDGVFLREVNPGATTREFPDTLAFKCCHCNPLVRASRFLWPQVRDAPLAARPAPSPLNRTCTRTRQAQQHAERR